MAYSKHSIWNQHIPSDYDYVIIGAGLVGLQTALNVRRYRPDASIAIFEQGLMPVGASTRNAGFLCYGSLSEISNNITQLGEDKTLELMSHRLRGIEYFKKLLNIQLVSGGYEILEEPIEENYIDHINNLIEKYSVSRPLYVDFSNYLQALKFKGIKQLIRHREECAINSGELWTNLFTLVKQNGIDAHFGVKVQSIEPGRINISDQFDTHTTHTNGIAVCTNAYISQLLPQYNIKPGRGQILVTQPLKHNLQAPFHYNNGYVYLRPLGNSILIGGGRNLNFESETTFALEENTNITQYLLSILNDIIIPGQDIKIETIWSGLMGFSDTHTPIIERVNNSNIVVGFGCNGMGVSLSPWTAQQVADLLVQ